MTVTGADAQLVGLVAAGTSALAAGLLGAAVLSRRRGAARSRWQWWALLSVATWGVGTLVLAAERGPDGWGPVHVGDVLVHLSIAFALAGFLTVPRVGRFSRPMLRLLLEALVIASAAGLALWWAAVAPVVATREEIVASADRLALLALGLTLVAAVLLLWLRDADRMLLPALVGLGAHTVAVLLVVVASAHERAVPWQAGALWALAWPAVTVTALGYRPPTADTLDPEVAAHREAVATYVSTALVVVLVVAGVLLESTPPAEIVSDVLAITLVAGIGVREAFATRIRRTMTAELRQQALTDPLTGLANRRALTAALARAGADAVVLTLDLDGFKRVNDLLGHAAGDELLVRVAEAMRPAVPSGAVVARTGGDEFAVLVPGGLCAGQAIAEQVRDAVTAVVHDGTGLGLSVSVGVGRLVADDQVGTGGGAGDGDRFARLAESAAALRAAKLAGRDRVVVYGGPIAAARDRRLAVERRLRTAVEEGRVDVVAQPVVDLVSGEVRGFETLARWTDDELGVVPPDEFVPVAEASGLVVALGEHVLRTSLAQAVALGATARGLSVAVNASPVQLREPAFLRLVDDVLAEHALAPSLLVVEVTEALLVDVDDPAVATLTGLAQRGVVVAVDDYGTGYSSLGYLLRLPVDVLKIDRSLTTTSLVEPRALAVVESVLDVADRLGLGVVLEGIETAQLADHCRRLGAVGGQGWWFGRAAPWPEALRDAPAAVAPTRPPHPRTARLDSTR